MIDREDAKDPCCKSQSVMTKRFSCTPIDEPSDMTWSGVDIVDAILNHTVPTAKADARHHGIGLRNVREKVEKYSSSLEIEVEGNLFTVTALLFFEKTEP